MTYIWSIPDNSPEVLIGEYDDEQSPSRFLLDEVKAMNLPTTLIVNYEGTVQQLLKFDDLPNDAQVPIVSAKVISIIEAFDAKVQFIDVKVVAKNGFITNYKALNALETIQALNKDKSEVNFIPGTQHIMSFGNYVYFDIDIPIARETDYMQHLILNDKLADTLKANTNGLGLFKVG